MFENAYQIARRVYANDIQRSDGVQLLVDEHNMGRSSAGYYIHAYQKMRTGERYTRTINTAATEYYLTHIYRDEGHRRVKKGYYRRYRAYCLL
jgi:5-methylcytosine-specific restriction protein A